MNEVVGNEKATQRQRELAEKLEERKETNTDSKSRSAQLLKKRK